MPYCEHCINYKEKMTITKIGKWMGVCLIFNICRNIDNDICDKYKEKPNLEKIIVHRAEIRKERLDDRFE